MTSSGTRSGRRVIGPRSRTEIKDSTWLAPTEGPCYHAALMSAAASHEAQAGALIRQA